ncbi:MAG: transporter, partial [Saprospiraceae bacterium]
MKITTHYWFSFLLLLTCIASVNAQTPTDATLMTKGQICLAAIYSHDSWDEYWEGTLLRSNG